MDLISREFSMEVRKKIGPSLRTIHLFGSRARGNAGEDSDYDMLVVVDERTPMIRSLILEVEVSLMDRYGVLVSTLLRSEEEWDRSKRFPLARNIAQEGLAL